ncbi:uncharacterized protein Dsimw501_GD29182, isoform B [Drosophila simulans]|uniref:Uncharacterized protein, isoform B n=1 Tax=Drosophila simulans TaxID=7240 RepID=A0A0J9U3Y2_DROSI|nr:uncharacterized protein Dsimw501_GD29182, isoform B [Drosophila simulans]
MEGNDDGFVWKMNGESSNCATISTPSAGNPSGHPLNTFLNTISIFEKTTKKDLYQFLCEEAFEN